MRPLAAALADFRQKLADPALRDLLQPVPGFPSVQGLQDQQSSPAGG
jgi:hypothetical protein